VNTNNLDVIKQYVWDLLINAIENLITEGYITDDLIPYILHTA
jgi:hypothetical protein